MYTQSNEKCPRCGEGRLRSWDELDEEARMIVRRLAGAASYSPSEREKTHRWCTRCWHEETRGATHDA